jgi:glutamate-5-semialdehyde dehydrogenase
METVADSAVLNLARAARLASASLAVLTSRQKDEALLVIADALVQKAESIEAENKKDLDSAREKVEKGELNASLYQRLKLDKGKLASVVDGIGQIAAMSDPVGKTTLARQLDDNLKLFRVSCPIGVIAVIFESRPDALPQILSLCLKSGNAIILKGGAEAEKSNRILFDTMAEAARKAGLPRGAFALLETRSDVKELLAADGLVDLIVPRGSNSLVRYIQNNTRIPVLGHADGVCHIYIDESALIDMAVALTLDSKVQYPSACNSVETVLIHRAILPAVLPELCAALQKENVELRLDDCCRELLQNSENNSKDTLLPLDRAKIKAASQDDWTSEYCDLILSIKAVDSMQEAIAHINQYGSGHTEAMVSENRQHFEEFFARVNSAGVYLNASTRFADGYRYGFGAEVGISTGKLHPRGPVGVEGLVTYKYKLSGSGHVVADYVGPQARQFQHRDLEC